MNTDKQTVEYRVTVRFQFPTWDEKGGLTQDIEAKSKSEAIRIAKRNWEDWGRTGCGVKSGLQWFSAKEISNFDL